MKQSVVEDNTDIAPINWEANGALVEERIEKQREWLLMAGWVFFSISDLATQPDDGGFSFVTFASFFK